MMRTRRQIKNPQAESAGYRRRAWAGFAIAALLLCVLGARFVYLQVVEYEQFHIRSEANRIKPRPIVPARGLIYDRNGRLLADNVPAYRLEVIPEQVKDVDALLADLGQVLPLSEDEIADFRAAFRVKRGFHPVPLKLRLTEAQVAAFAVQRYRFPGVDVAPYLNRRYPYGDLFAHVIGYVGRIDTRDLETLDATRYSGATHIGKSGIERFYESRLHGDVGFEQVEINAEGRDLRVLDRIPAHSGEHLILSIDVDLQRAMVDAFEGQHGAAVAVDPRTGEVLGMVSLPSYDPNPFVNGIGRQAYADLLNAPPRPLFNRVLQGNYEPGSTIKPFVGLAGLELGLRKPGDTTFSSGAFRLPGQQREYRDWRRGGHGNVDLREAIAQSVNTYFYKLAVDLGIDRLTEYTGKFGFGEKTGIDLPGETVGVLPTREWKRRERGQVWYPGETVIAGIGQGFWVVTPLQLAQATATLAAGGRKHRLHLLRATQAGFDSPQVPEPMPPEGPPLVSNPANLAAVIEGMVAVMHGPTGSARAAAEGVDYLIAGKTGTAQRVGRTSDAQIDINTLAFDLRYRALFIAFAPADAPRIAVMVVVESGASGSKTAAPVARRILDAWLGKNPA
ncbi:penicillin-binding protein 2 [Chiayiivirga flava]|uniref:Peptidoglycan D,D-transpeptidase MrdA n=1 Tax=Chiayiivirga flava TaxID=659595 RepID=A0A7W8D605_9GAMM|nr:penicillin-binding protein 2 [Chiayiivirga flava]MBB5207435.1 penicillin-binding protein 2 [Chiayiivirga flava]